MNNIQQMSNHLTTVIATTLNKTKCTPEEYKKIIGNAMKDIRNVYVKIFDEQLNVHHSNPNWWKEQFNTIANIMTEKYHNVTCSADDNFKKLVVSYNNNLIEFGTDKKMILVGRINGCDVELDKYDPTISRLHAIILVMSGIKKILVLDVGSFNGIITTLRSSKEPLEVSSHNLRKILEFNINETFSLEMGNANITISPKECIICFSKPRSCVYACGHYACCLECSNKIHECPVCRTPKKITKINAVELHTKVI